jgi:uncharacterized protein YlxP (DUF503 family)
MDDIRVYRGSLVADLVLRQARSVKERRGPLRAVIQKLRNQGLAVAQVGPQDRYQRAFLAVCAVSGSEHQVAGLLDAAERILFASNFEIAELRRDMTSESQPSR